MCRHTEIRISVSEEDTVGTGKAPFFKEVGERGETKIKTKGLKSKICENSYNSVGKELKYIFKNGQIFCKDIFFQRRLKAF